MSKLHREYISFLDIVPGKAYLAHTDGGFKRPCTVVCDDTHGWQRGWVKKMDEIHRNDRHAMAATLKFLEPQFSSRDVYCELIGDEYRFKSWFSDPNPLLFHLPDNRFDDEIRRLQKQQEHIQTQVDTLINLRESSKN